MNPRTGVRAATARIPALRRGRRFENERSRSRTKPGPRTRRSGESARTTQLTWHTLGARSARERGPGLTAAELATGLPALATRCSALLEMPGGQGSAEVRRAIEDRSR